MGNPQEPQTQNDQAEEQGEIQFSNGELIQRYNLLQQVKQSYTVPKIKLAFSRNMSRIEQAIQPFREAESDLKEEYDIGDRQPIFGEQGEQREEIDEGFYEEREEYLKSDAEPYEPYTVPESLLDNEPGQMRDGRVGMPEGGIQAVLWMFEE